MDNSQLSANKTSSGGEGGYFEYSHYTGLCDGGYGGAGGGVYNTGSMQIDASEINLNTAGRGAEKRGKGGEGGGIYNSGSLTINNSQVYGNSTGDGAFGYTREGGWGGSGGGIYNRGQLNITDSPVEGNQTGSGGRGGGSKYSGPLVGGNGGCGGGIFNQSNGILVLNITPIRDNITGPGGPSDSSGGWQDPGWSTSSEGGKGRFV
jgi:hypothetical protein